MVPVPDSPDVDIQSEHAADSFEDSHMAAIDSSFADIPAVTDSSFADIPAVTDSTADYSLDSCWYTVVVFAGVYWR
jgi:hypothetical protein